MNDTNRFDIICVLKDEPDPDLDALLGAFVINNHLKFHPTVANAK